ncbi:hypothetical protein HMPREF1982_03673 [Clostridiales bacterium oral taxon 876 str. F0540]|nr:hypothetical protein HMPREF1982_03673 [Clostridiales bacterium oral taxon 876 str. F0540]
MKKLNIIIATIAVSVLFSGCSKILKTSNTVTSTSTSTNTSTTSNTTDKTTIDKLNNEYKITLQKLKNDYVGKRDQMYTKSSDKYKISFDDKEKEMVKTANEVINAAMSELDKVNKEQLDMIKKAYDLEVEKINAENLTADEKTKALNTAINNKAQSDYNQKLRYEERKLFIQRIKRSYENSLNSIKNTKDNDLTNLFKNVKKEYDSKYEKLTSATGGQGSEWDRLFNLEQQNIDKIYLDESKKFEDSLVGLDKWLRDSFK